MSSAKFDPTLKQRLCMFYGSTLPPSEVVEVQTADITRDLLVSKRCDYQCIAAAGVSLTTLCSIGCSAPDDLRILGMDAIDVSDTDRAREMVRLYGADAVRATFLRTAEDAVALASTAAPETLGITLDHLLEQCVGQPTLARSVLESHPNLLSTLPSTSVRRILNTGMRAHSLAEAGASLGTCIEYLAPNTRDLQQLGFFASAGL